MWVGRLSRFVGAGADEDQRVARMMDGPPPSMRLGLDERGGFGRDGADARERGTLRVGKAEAARQRCVLACEVPPDDD
jgi:hypothetical protein